MKNHFSFGKLTRTVAMMMIFVTLSTVAFVAPAYAASSWPSLSSSSYCEFTAWKNINVYRNSGCTARGTSSPAKSYNAAVYSGDICKIIYISSSYVQLQYPTSSGYKTGYVKRSDIFNVSSPSECVTSVSKVTTYKSAGGGSYGYIAATDRVYACGTSGSYTAVIYEARSGSRAYKLGYVTTSSFNSGVKRAFTNNSNASSGSWQFPMNNYSVTQNFGTYSSSMASTKGRPYHSGIDMKSTDTRVFAAANGTIMYKGYTSGNGNHVVIEHNLNGTTVYTLYSHLANFTNCPAVGSYVSKGRQIGVMGNTGNSTGAHLHFGVFTGYSSDPVGYTDKYGANKVTYKNGSTFYNPDYVVRYNKLP